MVLGKLAERYIKVLAFLRKENILDAFAIANTYYDCSALLGIDYYCVEQKIDDYIATYDIDYSNEKL